jgi:hypothetical protein
LLDSRGWGWRWDPHIFLDCGGLGLHDGRFRVEHSAHMGVATDPVKLLDSVEQAHTRHRECSRVDAPPGRDGLSASDRSRDASHEEDLVDVDMQSIGWEETVSIEVVLCEHSINMVSE